MYIYIYIYICICIIVCIYTIYMYTYVRATLHITITICNWTPFLSLQPPIHTNKCIHIQSYIYIYIPMSDFPSLVEAFLFHFHFFFLHNFSFFSPSVDRKGDFGSQRPWPERRATSKRRCWISRLYVPYRPWLSATRGRYRIRKKSLRTWRIEESRRILRSNTFFDQVLDKRTDPILTFFYILTLGTYTKFAWKNEMPALGVRFP